MDEIQKFMQDYENALQATKWDELSKFFHSKCAMFYSDGTYIGKKALKKAFEKTFTLMKNGKFLIKNLFCPVVDDEYCSCYFKLEWSAEICGNLVTGEDRGTAFLVKENDNWVIVTQHLGPVAK